MLAATVRVALATLAAGAAAEALGGDAVDRAVAEERQCSFGMQPDLPYYWEPACSLEMPGCWADSANVECRFCGKAPFTGIPCPGEPADAAGAETAVGVVANEMLAAPPTGPAATEPAALVAPALAAAGKAFLAAAAVAAADEADQCTFDNPPVTPFYWEPQCEQGVLGCLADNVHVQCRFCGEGVYADIPCRPSVCSFANEPRTPYYWDEHCGMNVMGCNADAQHVQCRFCVQRPFSSVNCPASLRVEPGKCTFPGSEPPTPYYWDPSCEFGQLGCWADGLHAECRWCGAGAYQDVPCPP